MQSLYVFVLILSRTCALSSTRAHQQLTLLVTVDVKHHALSESAQQGCYTPDAHSCSTAPPPCILQEIDAYWLQRRIAKAFGDQSDPNAVQEQAEKVRLLPLLVLHPACYTWHLPSLYNLRVSCGWC